MPGFRNSVCASGLICVLFRLGMGGKVEEASTRRNEDSNLGGDLSNVDALLSDQGEAFIPNPLKKTVIFSKTFEFGARINQAINTSGQDKVR